MPKLKSLSIFFPCLNDAQIIPYLIDRAEKTAQELTDDFEIIVINDGSKDNSLEVLIKLQKKHPTLRVINHKTNLGYGATLTDGFTNAKKELVFYTDGDGQYDPAELKKLVNILDNETDIVNGFIENREDPLIRKALGNFYNFLLHRIYTLPIKEIDCDFRLIRKSLLDKIKLKEKSGAVCLELILKLQKEKARFKEIKVTHHHRPFGSSQFFQPKHLSTFIFGLFNIKYFSE